MHTPVSSLEPLSSLCSAFRDGERPVIICVLLTFQIMIFSFYSAFLVDRCFAGCLGAACIRLSTAIIISRMSSHWQAAAMKSIAPFTFLDILAAAACRWQSDIVLLLNIVDTD